MSGKCNVAIRKSSDTIAVRLTTVARNLCRGAFKTNSIPILKAISIGAFNARSDTNVRRVVIKDGNK